MIGGGWAAISQRKRWGHYATVANAQCMRNDVVEAAMTNLPDSRHAMSILGCADIHACMVCYYIIY